MKTRYAFAVAALASLVALIAAAPARAAVVTDTGAFSVGFGYDGTFSTNETSAANTPNTVTNGVTFSVGNFNINIGVTSTQFGSAGPTFPGRVLSPDTGGGQTAGSPYTTVTVTASYVGPALPVEATNPSFQLKIDQFSVWVMKHPAYVTEDVNDDDRTFYAQETTGLNPGTSPNMTPDLGYHGDVSAFDQLVWNPGDFSIANGTTSTRTFSFRPGHYTTDPAGVFVIDGLEIIGSANETYTIPEPASLSLLAAGGLLVFRRRRA